MDSTLAPVFHYVLPSPALRAYVKQFWIVGCLFSTGAALPVKLHWPAPKTACAFTRATARR
jgi:hypothetical protein